MARRAGVVGAYLVSCSSDGEWRLGQLYVWGEIAGTRWLASTAKEARMRIDACRKKMGCRMCDAEIHRAVIERTKPTLLQSRREEEHHRRKCE